MSRRGNGSFEMRSLSSESLPLTSPLRRHVSIFYRVVIVLTDPSRSLPALLVHRSSNPGNRIRFRPNLLSLKATAEVSNMLHWIYFLSLSQSVSLLFILSCLCTILVFAISGISFLHSWGIYRTTIHEELRKALSRGKRNARGGYGYMRDRLQTPFLRSLAERKHSRPLEIALDDLVTLKRWDVEIESLPTTAGEGTGEFMLLLLRMSRPPRQ